MRIITIIASFYILLLSFLVISDAAQPRRPRPATPDEVWQNDSDLFDEISKTRGRFESRTLAVIQAIIPLSVGESYYCSDCVSDAVCISTSTTQGEFSGVADRTSSCN